MLVAECGADVVKVEASTAGRGRTLLGFRTWNRSKRGVIADVSTQEGLETLMQLPSAADIFVHELGPTRARELAHGRMPAGIGPR